jgi:hypothetical protein
MGGPEQLVKYDMCGRKEVADKWTFGQDMAITEARQNCVGTAGTILGAQERHENIVN